MSMLMPDIYLLPAKWCGACARFHLRSPADRCEPRTDDCGDLVWLDHPPTKAGGTPHHFEVCECDACLAWRKRFAYQLGFLSFSSPTP